MNNKTTLTTVPEGYPYGYLKQVIGGGSRSADYALTWVLFRTIPDFVSGSGGYTYVTSDKYFARTTPPGNPNDKRTI